MGTRYLPRNDSELLGWLDNYGKQLGTYGKQVGLDPAAIKAQQALCSDITTAVQADEKARADWRAAVAHSAALKSQALQEIAACIDRLCTHPAASDEVKAALGVIPPASQQTAHTTLKIPINLEALPGRTVLRWRKGSLDGVNVYGQRDSETEWLLLGRDNRSPYEDTRQLNKPGAAEVRRYRVIGVVNDREVTPPSDTASITFAG